MYCSLLRLQAEDLIPISASFQFITSSLGPGATVRNGEVWQSSHVKQQNGSVHSVTIIPDQKSTLT